jgi:hypothetical protein
MRWTAMIGVVAGLAAATGSASAMAAPVERGAFHDEFSEFVPNFCDVDGLNVEVHVVTDGKFLVNTHGRDSLVYFAEHLRISGTFTNVDNERSVTNRERIVNKDLEVTDNGNGTLTVIVLATGNATVYGADGKAIGRNPGQVRFELLVDHGGTPADPLDDVLITDLGVIKGSTGRSDDFCSSVVPSLI